MTNTIRVVALGQQAGGDDGVGFAVLEELRRRGVPPGVRLLALADASDLLPLLDAPEPMVIVDAIRGGTPGLVLEVALEDLARGSAGQVSSHALGLAETVALSRALTPRRAPPALRILGVTMTGTRPGYQELSPAVAAAVSAAADRVLAVIGQT